MVYLLTSVAIVGLFIVKALCQYAVFVSATILLASVRNESKGRLVTFLKSLVPLHIAYVVLIFLSVTSNFGAYSKAEAVFPSIFLILEALFLLVCLLFCNLSACGYFLDWNKSSVEAIPNTDRDLEQHAPSKDRVQKLFEEQTSRLRCQLIWLSVLSLVTTVTMYTLA